MNLALKDNGFNFFTRSAAILGRKIILLASNLVTLIAFNLYFGLWEKWHNRVKWLSLSLLRGDIFRGNFVCI